MWKTEKDKDKRERVRNLLNKLNFEKGRRKRIKETEWLKERHIIK